MEAIRKLEDNVADHAASIQEHETKVNMFNEKTSILHKEVASMYRDLSLLENIKMDRSHATN